MRIKDHNYNFVKDRIFHADGFWLLQDPKDAGFNIQVDIFWQRGKKAFAKPWEQQVSIKFRVYRPNGQFLFEKDDGFTGRVGKNCYNGFLKGFSINKFTGSIN